MSWDFWRISWPNAAIVFALAMVPFFATVLHIISDERPPVIRGVGAPEPIAIVDSLLLPEPQ